MCIYQGLRMLSFTLRRINMRTLGSPENCDSISNMKNIFAYLYDHFFCKIRSCHVNLHSWIAGSAWKDPTQSEESLISLFTPPARVKVITRAPCRTWQRHSCVASMNAYFFSSRNYPTRHHTEGKIRYRFERDIKLDGQLLAIQSPHTVWWYQGRWLMNVLRTKGKENAGSASQFIASVAQVWQIQRLCYWVERSEENTLSEVLRNSTS